MAPRKKKKSKKELRLKKNTVKNLFLGGLFCSVAVGSYIFLDSAELFLRNYIDLFFKASGFKLENIRIVGSKNPELEKTIKNKIGIANGENIFRLSSGEIYQNISKITSIKDLSVRKILPNTLSVEITEKKPIAIFQKNSKFFTIDEDGSVITEVSARVNNFPIATGEEADINADALLKIISKFQIVRNKLDSIMFIRKRRWDIVVDGIQVKLPQDHIEQVLEILSILLKQPNINNHTVTSIDLRMQDHIAVKGLKIKSKAI